MFWNWAFFWGFGVGLNYTWMMGVAEMGRDSARDAAAYGY